MTDLAAQLVERGLEIVHVPADAIDPNPWNPNRQNETIARATRESLQLYGFVEPVALRIPPGYEEGRYQIVNGEHRWKEAVAMGYESIPAVVIDVTEEQAKKLTIVLNETSGDPDAVLLGQFLAELKEIELDQFAVALPFTPTELEQLLEIGSQDWDDYVASLPDPGQREHRDSSMKELVLIYSAEHLADVEQWCGIIAKEAGTTGMSETVYEALRTAAHTLNQT